MYSATLWSGRDPSGFAGRWQSPAQTATSTPVARCARPRRADDRPAAVIRHPRREAVRAAQRGLLFDTPRPGVRMIDASAVPPRHAGAGRYPRLLACVQQANPRLPALRPA